MIRGLQIWLNEQIKASGSQPAVRTPEESGFQFHIIIFEKEKYRLL